MLNVWKVFSTITVWLVFPFTSQGLKYLTFVLQ